MNRLRPLSDRDRQLLGLLKENGRISWTTAAHEMGVSRTALQKRVEALEASGWIKGFTVRLGGTVPEARGVEAFLRIKFIRGMDCFKLARRFATDGMVCGMWAVTGPWDAILHVRAERLEQISHFRELIVAVGGIEEIETEAILNDLMPE